jgi:hypothetical protein
VGKLKVKFVQHPPRLPKEQAPDVVEIYVGGCGRRVDLCIRRRGFTIADPVLQSIRERIRQLMIATAAINLPLPERIGFSPSLSPQWREFFTNVLQKGDSWAFFVSPAGNERLS